MRITKDGNTQIIFLDHCYPENGVLMMQDGGASGGVNITDPLAIDPEHIDPLIDSHAGYSLIPIINDGEVCNIRNYTIKPIPNRDRDIFNGTLDVTCSSTSTSVEIHATIKNCRWGFQIM
jgi:hypothetical protein